MGILSSLCFRYSNMVLHMLLSKLSHEMHTYCIYLVKHVSITQSDDQLFRVLPAGGKKKREREQNFQLRGWSRDFSMPQKKDLKTSESIDKVVTMVIIHVFVFLLSSSPAFVFRSLSTPPRHSHGLGAWLHVAGPRAMRRLLREQRGAVGPLGGSRRRGEVKKRFGGKEKKTKQIYQSTSTNRQSTPNQTSNQGQKKSIQTQQAKPTCQTPTKQAKPKQTSKKKLIKQNPTSHSQNGTTRNQNAPSAKTLRRSTPRRPVLRAAPATSAVVSSP